MHDVPPMFDADGAISREYLLYRGYCCRNGCRNCPYGYHRPAASHSPDDPDPGSKGERLSPSNED